MTFKMDITTEVLCQNDRKLWNFAVKANRASIVKGGAGSLENQMCYYYKVNFFDGDFD